MDLKVKINGIETTLFCDVSNTDNIEHWSVSGIFAKNLADDFRANGMEVVNVLKDGAYGIGRVDVDRSIYHFQGETYKLNQSEDNLFDWFANSKVGEFTYYFNRVVFHAADGCYGAYRDDINNIVKV